jgi:hypothetical protein
MYFELALAIFFLLLLIFIAFFLTMEGTKWQKHRFLGVFARFIQKSARRAFVVFFIITILIIPSTLFIGVGYWVENAPLPDTTPIVVTLLLMFLMLSGMIPVMWGRFRTWRQAVRAAAEVRVRTTT